MSNTSKKFTVNLDEVSSTKLQWISLFMTEAGMPKPKIREIIARCIDTHTELLEELCTTYACNPKHKDIRNELYELAQLRTPRRSAWISLDMPMIDLSSYGAFPKYSQLSRQYIQPVKTRLPRVKKPKAPGLSFAEIKAKHNQPTQP
jgi:hypothetical protein